MPVVCRRPRLTASTAAKSAAHATGPAALRADHRRPCGCYFSPWEDKGTFYYHRCVGTCSKTKATICASDGDCTKTCSITKAVSCPNGAGDCDKLCSLTKTYNIPTVWGDQTCDSQECKAVAGNTCEHHEVKEEHDCGVNGRKCVCMPQVD